MADFGWASSKRSYAGWVPNVGSHLSFSMIGAGRGIDVSRFSHAYSSPVGRVVCALAKRTTDDFLIPKRLKRLLDPTVAQHWLLTGRSIPVQTPAGVNDRKVTTDDGTEIVENKVTTIFDDQGMLSGKIHVIPHNPDRMSRLCEEALLIFLRNDFKDCKPDGKEALEKFIDRVDVDVHFLFADSVSLNFALMRTGEVRLWFSEKLADYEEGDHEVIARQAYYFIKDMVHLHVHHEPASDQITPLTRFDAGTEKTRERDEEDWRRQTMWSLSREAEKLGQRKRLDRLRDSLGIIAYADAFQMTLMPYIRDPKDVEGFVPKASAYGFDFKHIRESTRVQVDQLASTRGATAPFLAACVAGSIAVLAMLNAMISIKNMELARKVEAAKLAGKPVPELSFFSFNIPDWILLLFAEKPPAAAALVVALVYALFSWFLGDVFKLSGHKGRHALVGASISLARKLKLSSKWAFRFQNFSYAFAILLQLGLLYWVVRRI
ncbi:hypothetical protein ASE85_18990 [Sphingobium sp. Leaf26]|uniref:hypothetical protein n=1 Tax=Sphingobium sp. Leaf26 TaxID=1735693 RepID=UPI0006FC8AA4|nr:hypothetical protein [Sphingobium sp. Leaf26]KQN07149.1 hypothetical protein ASE85_18990 [Sphingobium sp. Leaf26]